MFRPWTVSLKFSHRKSKSRNPSFTGGLWRKRLRFCVKYQTWKIHDNFFTFSGTKRRCQQSSATLAKVSEPTLTNFPNQKPTELTKQKWSHFEKVRNELFATTRPLLPIFPTTRRPRRDLTDAVWAVRERIESGKCSQSYQSIDKNSISKNQWRNMENTN